MENLKTINIFFNKSKKRIKMKTITKTLMVIGVLGTLVSCRSTFDAAQTMEVMDNRSAVYQEIISSPSQLNEFIDLAQKDEEASKIIMQKHMQLMESGKMKMMMQDNPEMKEKMKTHMQKMMQDNPEMKEKMQSMMLDKMLKSEEGKKMLMQKMQENNEITDEMKGKMMQKIMDTPEMMEEMMRKMLDKNPEMMEKMKDKMNNK